MKTMRIVSGRVIIASCLFLVSAPLFGLSSSKETGSALVLAAAEDTDSAFDRGHRSHQQQHQHQHQHRHGQRQDGHEPTLTNYEARSGDDKDDHTNSRKVHESFMRAMNSNPQQKHKHEHTHKHKRKLGSSKSEDSGDDGLRQCQGGCQSDHDCQDWLVCYRRNAGDALPNCCVAAEENTQDGEVSGLGVALIASGTLNQSSDTNFCVSAGCAAYTDDDDDAIQGESKLQICQGNCYANSDCAGDLVCFIIGEYPIPNCCKPVIEHHRNLGNEWVTTGLCAPKGCNTPKQSKTNQTYIRGVDYNATVNFTGLTAGLGTCFSGETLVHVQRQGNQPMKSLQVGDLVLTKSSTTSVFTYQPIYAFAHLNRDRPAQFLQIHVSPPPNIKTSDSFFEVTAEHLVYLQGIKGPVRADRVQVGDILQSLSGARKVTAIQNVTRNGLYAPLTPDGAIVVNGIKASNYIAVQSNATSEYVELPGVGVIRFLHQATLVHLWLTPLRLLCHSSALTTTTQPAMCSTYNEDGMLHYVDVGLSFTRFMEDRPSVIQVFVLISLMLFFSFLMGIEYIISIFGAKTGALLLVTLGTTVAMSWLQRRRRQNLMRRRQNLMR